MHRFWMDKRPPVHNHPHHDKFLACRCFQVDFSLSYSALDVFMNNLGIYTKEDLNCVRYFPANIKNLIARKFLSTRAYFRNGHVDYKHVIAVCLHERTTEANLTLYHVDDDIMRSLEVCKHLQWLRVDGSVEVHNGSDAGDDLSADALIRAVRNFSHLWNLCIANTPAVTDDVVAAIVQNCPKLRKLDLCNCPNVGDKGLTALLQLKELTSLDLSGSQVTDEGLQAIADDKFLETVEDIRLDNCKRIKNFDVCLFASKCKVLTMFSMRGSPIADKMNNWDSHHLKNLKQINWAIEW